MTGIYIMKEFSLWFWKDSGFLECRQCSHKTIEEADEEAKLYKAWAEYHYGCEVYYEIDIINRS